MANNNSLCSKVLTNKTKKTNVKQRICFVCKILKPAPELIRIARIDEKYIIDECGNSNGRGCHICPSCIEKAIKTRSLNKSFKAKVPDEIYELLAKHST